MSRNELSEDGDWDAVHTAIHRQRRRLDMSIAHLSRESGINENTIRYIARAEKRQRSTLVALSAALGCGHDYLVKVLRGEVDPIDLPQPPTEAAFTKDLLRAEVDRLKVKLDQLGDALYAIDNKVNIIIEQHGKELL